VSYEAKARGVKRGMTIREVQHICPDAIPLPSDYETYSLFSQRMFAIVQRYTYDVEEYRVDECFAELTGLRRPLWPMRHW
jgi:nucleotidyltransferase/DNA polymerase involved in DNA repair